MSILREFGIGGVLMVGGVKVIALELEISNSVQSVAASGVWDTKSMEYGTLVLSNVNGMLIGFLMTAIGLYLLMGGIEPLCDNIYTYLKNRRRDTL